MSSHYTQKSHFLTSQTLLNLRRGLWKTLFSFLIKKVGEAIHKFPLKLRGIKGVRNWLFFILIFTFLIIPSEATAATLNRAPNNLGLVGYWSMNEGVGTKVGDASGNRNTGIITGASWTSGKRGKALSFDGNDYVDVGDPASGVLNFGTGSFSYSLWFKSSGADDLAISKAVTEILTGAGYDLLIGAGSNPGNIRGRISDGVGSLVATPNLAWTGTNDGKWHHAVVVVDRTAQVIKLYGDNIQRGADVSIASTGSVSNAGNFYLGREGTYYLVGSVDDVRIYNRALTQAEITKLYQSGAVKINTSSADLDNGSTLEQGLVGLWTFDGKDISGTSALDKSGQGNNGTITGATKTIGKLGQGLSFDGSDDCVTTSGPSLSSITRTFSFWLKTTETTEFRTWFSVGLNNTNLVRVLCSNLWLNYNPIIGGPDIQSGVNVSDNKWHHIVVGDSSLSSHFIYIDGVLKKTDTTTIASYTSNVVGIGCRYWQNGPSPESWAQGQIDEVRIYNRALSSDEIKQLYNMGK